MWSAFSKTGCTRGLINGVELEMDAKGGITYGDRSADNLRMFCSSNQTLEGVCLAKRGKWQGPRYCQRNMAVCGIRVRIDYKKGG